MENWKCTKCGEVISAAKQPKHCPFCDSTMKSAAVAEIEEYDVQLDAICEKLNVLYNEMAPLKEEYYSLMKYFRTQRQKGNLTPKEYDARASKFLGWKPGKKVSRDE
jgi:NAD-dependent SIR2 family protein deacetylase